jgi:hypothetical protein
LISERGGGGAGDNVDEGGDDDGGFLVRGETSRRWLWLRSGSSAAVEFVDGWHIWWFVFADV